MCFYKVLCSNSLNFTFLSSRPLLFHSHTLFSFLCFSLCFSLDLACSHHLMWPVVFQFIMCTHFQVPVFLLCRILCVSPCTFSSFLFTSLCTVILTFPIQLFLIPLSPLCLRHPPLLSSLRLPYSSTHPSLAIVILTFPLSFHFPLILWIIGHVLCRLVQSSFSCSRPARPHPLNPDSLSLNPQPQPLILCPLRFHSLSLNLALFPST